jgi:thymidylate kinase
VLLDRYIIDTVVDFRLNFPGEGTEAGMLWRTMARLAVRPDAAIFLRVPVNVSIQRCAKKDEPFPDSPERLAERLALYDALAGGYTTVDASGAIEHVHAAVIEALPAEARR